MIRSNQPGAPHALHRCTGPAHHAINAQVHWSLLVPPCCRAIDRRAPTTRAPRGVAAACSLGIKRPARGQGIGVPHRSCRQTGMQPNSSTALMGSCHSAKQGCEAASGHHMHALQGGHGMAQRAGAPRLGDLEHHHCRRHCIKRLLPRIAGDLNERQMGAQCAFLLRTDQQGQPQNRAADAGRAGGGPRRVPPPALCLSQSRNGPPPQQLLRPAPDPPSSPAGCSAGRTTQRDSPLLLPSCWISHARDNWSV